MCYSTTKFNLPTTKFNAYRTLSQRLRKRSVTPVGLWHKRGPNQLKLLLKDPLKRRDARRRLRKRSVTTSKKRNEPAPYSTPLLPGDIYIQPTKRIKATPTATRNPWAKDRHSPSSPRSENPTATATPTATRGAKVRQGDIIDLCQQGEIDVMIHGCNCFHSMSGGLAKQVSQRHPKACQADLFTARGDPTKLGLYSAAEIRQPNGHRFTIVNAYTQFHPSSGTRVDIDTHALRKALRLIKKHFAGKRIAYPQIGCGLAGGNWDEIYPIIQEELEGQDHTFVDYN